MRLRHDPIPVIALIIIISLFMMVCLKACVTENDIIIDPEPASYELESRKDRIKILKDMFDESYNIEYLIKYSDEIQNKVLQVRILEQIQRELRQYH